MPRDPQRARCVVLTLFCLGLLGFAGPAAASPGLPPHPTPLYADSDGDGIPDDLDPDDDNDGISDGNESDPNATPDNAPIPDDDSDGITNDNDPDDNNNAVTDEDEPIPAAVTNDPPPSSGGSSGGSQGAPDNSGSLVRSLPVTGSGSGGSPSSALLLWACVGLAGMSMIGGALARPRLAVIRH